MRRHIAPYALLILLGLWVGIASAGTGKIDTVVRQVLVELGIITAAGSYSGVDGSLTATHVTYASDANTIAGEAALTYNASTNVLTVEDVAIGGTLVVTGVSDFVGNVSDSGGDFTIADNLDVTGEIDCQGTLDIDMDLTIGGVTGTAAWIPAVASGGGMEWVENSGVSGLTADQLAVAASATTVDGDGSLTFTSPLLTVPNINVTGTMGPVTISGAVTIAGATAGDLSVGDDITVTGLATCSTFRQAGGGDWALTSNRGLLFASDNQIVWSSTTSYNGAYSAGLDYAGAYQVRATDGYNLATGLGQFITRVVTESHGSGDTLTFSESNSMHIGAAALTLVLPTLNVGGTLDGTRFDFFCLAGSLTIDPAAGDAIRWTDSVTETEGDALQGEIGASMTLISHGTAWYGFGDQGTWGVP
jgi:hypothetical protein